MMLPALADERLETLIATDVALDGHDEFSDREIPRGCK